MILVTFETWAYINAQLDYPPSKRRKLHILNAEGTHTLCGRRAIGVESSEDEWDSLNDILIVECQICQRCRNIYEPPRPKTKELVDAQTAARKLQKELKELKKLIALKAALKEASQK